MSISILRSLGSALTGALSGTLVATAVLAHPLAAQSPAVALRDLADAYLQVDAVAMARGVPQAQRAAWNRDFDRTTLAFFGGDFRRVVRDMHDLVARMVGDSAVNSPTRQLLALRLRGAPRVLVAGRDRTLSVTATVLYAAEGIAPARTVQLRLLDASGVQYSAGTIVIPPGVLDGTSVSATLSIDDIVRAPGRYVVEATLPGAQLPLRTEVFVLAEPADSVRARLLRDIAALPGSTDPQAVTSLRARAELIAERVNENNSAQFIADPAALAVELERELRLAGSGRAPYAQRAGDIWRVITGPNGRIAFRLYAPREVNTATPLPVVFALHGAGTDENMFLEGYGDGRLRALADSIGFILVSPATANLGPNLAAFDSLLAVVARDYVIDRRRIHIVGHSAGGALAAQLAEARRTQIRSAAVIAGVGAVPANGQMSPTLFVGAETDLVIPVTRVRASYEQVLASGALVEFRQADGWGHTLVVGALLDDVARWIFNR
jgi:predicted esterase